MGYGQVGVVREFGECYMWVRVDKGVKSCFHTLHMPNAGPPAAAVHGSNAICRGNQPSRWDKAEILPSDEFR